MKQNRPSSAIFTTYILREKLELDSKQIFTFAHFYFDCGHSEPDLSCELFRSSIRPSYLP